jgi:hypothetical protein
LAPAATCVINVTFTPNSTGNKVGAQGLTVMSGNGFGVILTGTGR